MKIILCGISLIISLTGNVWARDLNTVKVDVLAKTGISWDGKNSSWLRTWQAGDYNFKDSNTSTDATAATQTSSDKRRRIIARESYGGNRR